MNWKEFFRPTLVKIIIALIILLFMPLMFEEVCYTYVDGGGKCSSSYLQTYHVFTGKIAFYVLPMYYFFYISIIISYSLSCTLIFLLNKFKKTKCQK